MWVILLEAAGAMVLLVLIVWWTMFSGRDKGELRAESSEPKPKQSKAVPQQEDAKPPE